MPRGGFGPLIFSAFGAALLALALPRTSFWPLGWIGLAPLFLFCGRAKPGRAAWAGWLAGFAYHAVALHWVYRTCRFALVPVPIASLAWAALAGFLALNWAIAAGIFAWAARPAPRALRPWLAALAWTAVAAATGAWTPRLAADVLAYTQWPNLALIQCSSWGGPYLLGSVIVLFNASLAEAWEDVSSGRSAAAPPLSCAILAAAALWAHGAFILASRPAAAGPTVSVELLQPNIDQYQKWDRDFAANILKGFERLMSLPRARQPALVIWPEAAIPRWVERERAVPEAAFWARKLGAAQLVGVVAAPVDGLGPANGVQSIGPNGLANGFYAKRELVPFGEYVPFRSLIPRWAMERWLGILDRMGDMSAGAPGQSLLDTPLGLASVTVCYEAVFPRLSRRDAELGARLLVNVTNDGWYKDTWGPYQHFMANAFRAIENRITVLRAGNTGISAAINPFGEITAMLPLNRRGRLDVDIPVEDSFPSHSFYSRHGDWFGMSCLGLLALIVVWRARSRP